MPRTRKIHKEMDDAAKAVAELVAPKGRKRAPSRRAGPTKQGIERTMAEMNAMRSAGDWSKARPAHLVALYAWCHEQTYDVAPAELVGLNWMGAASAAAKMVRDEFNGSTDEALEFMRWVWRREKGREKWRRESGSEGGRISWRAQFQHRYIMTDYRIDQARRHKK